MKKKKKAKKNGESFVVSDDEEDMKDFTYRSQKRKQRGIADTSISFLALISSRLLRQLVFFSKLKYDPFFRHWLKHNPRFSSSGLFSTRRRMSETDEQVRQM